MSWESGIIIIGIVCFFLGNITLKIKHTGLKIIFILLTPYLLSLITYWGYAHLSGNSEDGQLQSWSGLFIQTWTLSGLAGLLLGMAVFSKSGKVNEKNS